MLPAGKKNNDVCGCAELVGLDQDQTNELVKHLCTIAEVDWEYTDTGECVLLVTTCETGFSVSHLDDGRAVLQSFSGRAKEFESFEVAVLNLIDTIDHFCF
ncbi:hypothetical protein [Roseibium alexandrii]|uniref:Uncharacterized protein n=1 Tax=Roseibium alexandrii (strain DSM 17067 / NCIMB 14079 / DFL-11) TaxID=244592 RepID=A0A5E8GU57_ROSAD|nr:hypothetical protein [Roseibium alexandrii]EEE42861.2 hypothetical protein SADFL11_PLAS33 [Roseibium alexandrii DFL-11]